MVGWLVVVARGLYLARHEFTLLESSRVEKRSGDGERSMCWGKPPTEAVAI